MPHWKLLKLLLNHKFIMLSMSFLALTIAVIGAIYLKTKSPEYHDIRVLMNAIAITCGVGFYLLFLVIGDRLRSLMSYDFNYLLPNFRQAQLKSVGYCFLILFILPMLIFLLSGSISLLHVLIISVLCALVLVANLFNQLATFVLVFIFLFVGTYESNKANKSASYQAFEFLPFSLEISLTIIFIILVPLFVFLVLKLPKQLIGTSKGKSAVEKVKIDPLVTKSKILLKIRQSLLSYIYDAFSPLKSFQKNNIVCFWNYKFTNLNFIRMAFVLFAIFPEIFSDFYLGWQSVDNEQVTNKKESGGLPQFVSLFSFWVFAIFDGNKLALTSQATRFLWLKQSTNGVTSFVNSLYSRMAKIAIKEILISYITFAFIISQYGFNHFDIVFLTVSFIAIKIVNILLMQLLAAAKERRWIWLAVFIANIALVLGFVVIKDMTSIDKTTASSMLLIISTLICFYYFNKQYRAQVNTDSLI